MKKNAIMKASKLGGTLSFDRVLIDAIKKHYLTIGFVVISVAALVLRWSVRSYVSGDMNDFLLPWFDALKTGGGMSALANYEGDYNAPYVTILALLSYLPFSGTTMIKMVSCGFDFVLAVGCVFLARELLKGRRVTKNKINIISLVVFTAVLFLPTVIMNSAFWGQCDCIYTSFIVFALYFFLKKKFPICFIFLGIAFAFKLQTVFIFPMLIVAYFCKRNFSILNFLIIPVVDFVLCIPALLNGWPFDKIFGIYLHQAGETGRGLDWGFPNFYSLVNGVYDNGVYFAGLIATIAVLTIMALVCINLKIAWNNQQLMMLAIISILLISFVMPGMHERYLFLGEILCCIYCIAFNRQWCLLFALLVTATMTYSSYLFGVSISQGQKLVLYTGLLMVAALRARYLSGKKNEFLVN